MINTQLKKAIIDYIIENYNLFGRLRHTIDKFNRYIFDENGDYLIGGKEVIEWIESIDKLI
jgi:hypothetical protein